MKRNRVNVLTVVNSASNITTETIDGKPHIVVRGITPVVDDIVMNRKLYPAAEIEKAYNTLERNPMPLGHPKVDGKHVSARDVRAVNEYHVGAWLQNVSHKDGKVTGDMYVNRQYAESSDKGKRLINRLDEMLAGTNSDPIHISTGLLYSGIAANGESKGKKYNEIATNMMFDHVAVLLDEPGAGTPEEGVGIFVNSEGDEQKIEVARLADGIDCTRDGLINKTKFFFTNASNFSFDDISRAISDKLREGAGLSNKAALLVGDLAAVSKASQTAANTKPIEIKTTATGKKAKGGKSAAQKEAEQYAKSQESVNQKLDELKQKSELSAGSVGELSRAQAVLNAQQSLGNTATEEQLMLAGQLAGKAWDNANALREQAKAERDRTDAANKFTSIQGKTSKTAGLDSQYQKDIADIDQYAQLYPQKIGEAEAARAAIEQQYRDQRNAAMWEEWAQQNAATQAAAAAFDSLGSVASNALTGIITGSMSASDAMRSIGMTVLNSVINTFVQMGVEWVKSAIMGQTATTAAVAASTTAQAAGIATTTATSTAAAAATTAAWTPAAIMSSIASFGGAVAIGIGAMAGILALSGKRKNGGPVSAGGMYQVGEGGMPEIYQASTGKQYMI